MTAKVAIAVLTRTLRCLAARDGSMVRKICTAAASCSRCRMVSATRTGRDWGRQRTTRQGSVGASAEATFVAIPQVWSRVICGRLGITAMITDPPLIATARLHGFSAVFGVKFTT